MEKVQIEKIQYKKFSKGQRSGEEYASFLIDGAWHNCFNVPVDKIRANLKQGDEMECEIKLDNGYKNISNINLPETVSENQENKSVSKTAVNSDTLSEVKKMIDYIDEKYQDLNQETLSRAELKLSSASFKIQDAYYKKYLDISLLERKYKEEKERAIKNRGDGVKKTDAERDFALNNTTEKEKIIKDKITVEYYSDVIRSIQNINLAIKDRLKTLMNN